MAADPIGPFGLPNSAADAPHSQTELAALLDRSVASLPPRADGIAIGEVVAITKGGLPVVRIAAFHLETTATASMVALDAGHVGQSVAVGFAGGNAAMPIVLGLMVMPTAKGSSEVRSAIRPEARVDGERVLLQAEHEIELRCGEAAIVLTADGRITIRGTYITSQASATQRILGGSVNVN